MTMTRYLFLVALLHHALVALADSSVTASILNLTDGSSDFDKVTNDLFTRGANLTLAPSIIAAIAIGAGIVIAGFGYKLFRPVLFICGFAVGAVLFYLLAERVFKNQAYMITAAWICFVVGGLLVGATVVCIWKVGVFMVGAAAGILLAFLLNTSGMYKLWPSNPNGMLYLLIVGLGLLGGFLARYLERPFLIIATSFFGATAAVWGVGFFAGSYPSGSDLESLRVELADGKFSYSISEAWWGYIAATAVLFLAAMYMQFTRTAMGIDHGSSRAMPSTSYAVSSSPTVGRPAVHVAPY
ncbi:Aste57867_23162 [Aphanomyces stellatus]|uniref:Transmembrane protein 198 n=1 Tax=Aphanomyces stellatus TaxID=120398 RepID=A0A485LN27_9STRA|nr:hypothetical protein As57867_023091 [Aphanomyces stellatus]VFT99810.1 Aste57867_23162 [Aphanomyces stellatus]